MLELSRNFYVLVNFVIVFNVVYLVYHITAYPSIAGGDSGELMAEACLHGIVREYNIFFILYHQFINIVIDD